MQIHWRSSWVIWGALMLLALLAHLPFLLMGSYQNSYDAYTHLFFASHWQHDWWSDFEPRWYTGFSVFLYPPFSHQLLALPAHWLHLESTYIAVQTLTILFIMVGMYRYTRIWFAPATSYLAALLVVFQSSLAITIHLFGQYPNTVSLALILNLAPFIRRWVWCGHKLDFGISLFLTGPLIFTSLFSNAFGVIFFILPVVCDYLYLLFQNKDSAIATGSGWRILWLFFGIATLAAICLSPFFYYLTTHPFEQMQIPHGSRDNVLLFNQDNFFGFYGLYGVFLVLLPLLIGYMFRQPHTLIFLPSIALLALFSTGGATPLNKLLLRGLFDVITFDRFSLWNTLLMTPLAAHVLIVMWNRPLHLCLKHSLRLVGLASLGLLFLGLFLMGATSPFWKALPKPLPLHEVKYFLEQPEPSHYRFITLGFGGNNLSRLTGTLSTPTLDGNYNFARRIVELNQSPIALIDEAKYYGPQAVEALAKFLMHPAKYHLRYVFLRDHYYRPLLQTAGWQQTHSFNNQITLWQPSWTIPPIPHKPPPNSPWGLRLIWGLGPLGSLTIALWLMLWRYLKEKSPNHLPVGEAPAHV